MVLRQRWRGLVAGVGAPIGGTAGQEAEKARSPGLARGLDRCHGQPQPRGWLSARPPVMHLLADAHTPQRGSGKLPRSRVQTVGRRVCSALEHLSLSSRSPSSYTDLGTLSTTSLPACLPASLPPTLLSRIHSRPPGPLSTPRRRRSQRSRELPRRPSPPPPCVRPSPRHD